MRIGFGLGVVDLAVRRALGGVVGPTPTPTPAMTFPAQGARYDIDFTTRDSGGAVLTYAAAPIPSNAAVFPTQPDNGTNNGDGRFFRQLVSPSSPRYTEHADGSLRRDTSTGLRLSTRGVWVFETGANGDNPILWSNDLTQAGWVKTGVIAALNQIDRANRANMASLLTASSAGGTVLFPTTAAANNRNLWADIKQVTGTGTVEMTVDGGATWVPIALNKPRFNGWGRYSIPRAALAANPSFGFRLGTAGDQIAVAFVQSDLFAFEAPPLEQVGATRRHWNDRPSSSIQGGSTTGTSSGLMDYLASGQPWGLFMEWVTQKPSSFLFGQILRPNTDGSITAGSVDSQPVLNTGPGVHRVTTDMAQPLTNRALMFIDTATGHGRLSANGSPVVAAVGLGAYTTLDHKDLGSNGAGTANMAGFIRRLAVFAEPPTDEQMRVWTAV